MVETKIGGNDAFTRAAERVRKQREAERAQATGEATPIAAPVKTTTQVRARLNFIPDDTTLKNLVDQALTALSRGVRWARGSIINIIT